MCEALAFNAPSNLFSIFLRVAFPPLYHTLTLGVFVFGTALLPIDSIPRLLFLTRNDGSIVVEAKGTPEVAKDFGSLEGEEVSARVYLHL